MNADPQQISVSLAISSKYTLDAFDELYEGILLACEKYKVDLIGGDTTSSEKGLIISVTAIGSSEKNKLVYRSGAKKNDLVAVTGNIGAAYMGLQILEREKEVFKVNPQSQPNLDKYTYCIQRQLKPEARKDIFQIAEIITSADVDEYEKTCPCTYKYYQVESFSFLALSNLR